MDRFKQFATAHPLAFGLQVAVVYILMLFVSAMLGVLLPGEETYGQIGGIIGRVASITVLLALLFRLGWLRPAGFTRLGRRQTWLLILLPLVYSIAVSAYAMTGNLDFRFSGAAPSGPVTLFILIAAFLEEVAFRGLILQAFVRGWGSTNRGLIKSVLISSLLFGAMHILDFLGGRPLPGVLLQSMEAFLLGIWLATLVLSGKSIYPAALFHAVFNLAAYLSFNGSEPAPSFWLLLSILMFPLALYGIYLLRGVSRRSVVPATA
jgi:membrane protease YdiL (CAAX protease family)